MRKDTARLPMLVLTFGLVATLLASRASTQTQSQDLCEEERGAALGLCHAYNNAVQCGQPDQGSVATGLNLFDTYCRLQGTAPPGAPIRCGGIAGIACSAGLVCIDDPSDGCDPTQGGADCGGICVASHEAASAFVTRLYQTVLGREPDPDGLQAFVAQIQQFGTVIPTVLAFFKSQEFLSRNITNEQFLTILYQALLNREPDSAGFNALLSDLNSGLRTRDNLIDIFLDSAEFAAVANFLPPQDPITAFVTTLYVRILGRGPDAGGLAAFVIQLQQSRTVLPTVLNFLHSPEFLSRNTSNAEFVTLLYRVFLNRVPDAAGLAGWVALLNQGTATRDQLGGQFTASPEFQAIQHQLFP